MYKRNLYFDKIKGFIDKPVIKVITGMRRVGKSYFLKQIINELLINGVDKKEILYIDKESLDFEYISDYKVLNREVKKYFLNLPKSPKKKYLFVDEVQEIVKWEKAILSFFNKGDIDIFITGSNAHILSSELATYLSGRYIEFPIYSLSFKEFLQFRGKSKKSPDIEFSNYLKYGGMPTIHHFSLDDEIVYQYISSIYNTILLKDVVKKNEIRNVSLLENILRYLFDNIGNIFSAKSISNYIKSQKIKVSVDTVQNYIRFLMDALLIHKVSRYDIKGKRQLEIHEKYYLDDFGIRNSILGYRESDIWGILENIVYLELKRRGYNVDIGKLDNQEIDFIAVRENEKIYIQVCYLLSSNSTIKREFDVLKKIKDNYPKYVISMDKFFGNDVEGIKRINLIDFCLEDIY